MTDKREPSSEPRRPRPVPEPARPPVRDKGNQTGNVSDQGGTNSGGPRRPPSD